MQHAVSQVVSKDGTPIAYDRVGVGPPIVFVVGAFNDRFTGGSLAQALAPRFTVVTYDRRGRGDSGDAQPYAVDREVEDLAAVIAANGGAAAVLGFSSGAILALKAHHLPITKLALYDTPLGAPGAEVDHAGHLAALIAAGRRGDAVEYFQTAVVGIPAAVVADLRHAPFRPALEKMAHTLVYDCTILGEGRLPRTLDIATPTLALAGGAAPPFMRATAEALARALPHARAQILEGQGHDLVPEVLAPVLTRFFAP